MFCRSCRYNLHGLDAGPCPECGTHFDPGLPESFFNSPHARPLSTWFTVACIVGSAGALIEIALIHLALVGARVSLGRWPHRLGRDDPKDVPGLGAVLYFIAALGTMLIPLSLASMILGVVVLSIRRRISAAVLVLLAFAASWIAARFIVQADPAQALVWFMD